jgi:hypothetical protein
VRAQETVEKAAETAGLARIGHAADLQTRAQRLVQEILLQLKQKKTIVFSV